ncbi:hypothetical protein C7C46_16070 [Streptomyces tateyamensis]|uniref:Uncharacterized protein n=1 Tax=Streptomyces tateyamensis TaxID=565073 RepID=A0A2V4NEG5_9ACTN|nr:hypothetical protein [Streptomyces tateyamensis]PYC78614.1 hypothetical protein C7C46_16070 [Streptomyces tateyamensis]
MTDLTVRAFIWLWQVLMPGTGRRRASKARNLHSILRTQLASPVVTAPPVTLIRVPLAGLRDLPTPLPRHIIERNRPLLGEDVELIRPALVQTEWYRAMLRRDALDAVAAGEPDPGYTYPGAHSVRGAAA